MAGTSRAFTFVCGDDDFMVGRAGAEHYARLCEGITDEFSREVIDGSAGNVEEVESAVNRFREAVQTLGLFGGRKAVWLKDVTFLADSQTGSAEGTLAQVEALREILAGVDPEGVAVLITASPVDRRRSFPRWCQANGDCVSVEAGADVFASLVQAEAARASVKVSPRAVEALSGRLNGNTRIAVNEVAKLATWLGKEGGTIEEKHVEELTPAVGEGEFFEAADAFFNRDPGKTLEAIRRHFFAGYQARPLLSALQGRNRLLLQIRALADAGLLRMGPKGADARALSQAAGRFAGFYGPAAAEKSGFNVFTQNAWYLGKIAGFSIEKLPPLRRLLDHQLEFIRAFRELNERPAEQQEVMRELAIRCLG